MKRLFYILALTLFVGQAAFSQNITIAKLNFEQAEEAYLKEDYAEALRKLNEAENKFGKINPPILYLRIMAQNKLIGPDPRDHDDYMLFLNLKKGCNFYLKEYEKVQGIEDKYKDVYKVADAISIFSDNENFWKARTYFYGDSIGYSNILGYCKKAIAEGDSWAMNLMGVMFYSGRGVAKDDKKSFEWYQMAADKGNVMAMENLGRIYISGNDFLPKNTSIGLNFLKKAANQGFAQSMIALGNFYYYGNDDVSLDYDEALIWYKRAAGKGELNAMNAIGAIFRDGSGVPKDYVEAMKWFKMSAEKGHTDALCNIGSLYVNEQGVSRDYNEAMKWFKKAAEKKHPRGYGGIAVLYKFGGYGVTQNYTEAMIWDKKAADLGWLYSIKRMGDYYAEGLGVTKSNSEALVWYTKAADKGDSEAMRKIAMIYQKGGYGIKRDKKQSIDWINKADAVSKK